MTRVYCDYNCKYSGKDSICENPIINMSINGGCEDYEEIQETDYPDTYYIFRKSEDKKTFVWQEKRGNRVIIKGREVFETFGKVTDGRTGSLIGHLDRNALTSVKKTIWEKTLKDAEEKYGLSPLYTDDLKYKVRGVSDETKKKE